MENIKNKNIQDLSKTIIEEINKIVEIKDLNSFFLLKNLNFEDLDYIELCLELEDKYDVFLDENTVENLETIDDLINYVFEKINK